MGHTVGLRTRLSQLRAAPLTTGATVGRHLGPRYIGSCSVRQGGCYAVLRPCARSAYHLSPALPTHGAHGRQDSRSLRAEFPPLPMRPPPPRPLGRSRCSRALPRNPALLGAGAEGVHLQEASGTGSGPWAHTGQITGEPLTTLVVVVGLSPLWSEPCSPGAPTTTRPVLAGRPSTQAACHL